MRRLFCGLILALASFNVYALQSGERIKCEGEGPLYRGMNNYAVGFIDTKDAKNCLLVLCAGCSVDKGTYHLFKPVKAGTAVSAPVYEDGGQIRFDEALKAYFKKQNAVGTCSLVKLSDGRIGAFISKGADVIRAVLNTDTLTFEKAGESLSGVGLNAVVMKDDGSIDIYGADYKKVTPARRVIQQNGKQANPWSENYQPFDGADVSREAVVYSGLTRFSIPNFFSEERSPRKRVSKGDAEFFGPQYMTSFKGVDGNVRILIGTHYGSMVCYVIAPDGTVSEKNDCKIGDTVFRGEAFGAGCAVKTSGSPDFYSGGESGIYFYKFKKYADDGAPVYDEGKLVLETSPNLYAGSLPVAQAVDFDGDGLLDIVSGNSQGEVWFFKNVGKEGEPKFIAGVPLTIRGEKMVEKSGYWAIQNFFESQWGYVSPCVFDWNGDGLPDLLTGDSSQRFGVYFNIGSKDKSDFAERKNLFCNGLEVHGTWRTRPTVARPMS